MSEVEENVELLRRAGAYEDDTAVLEDAIRVLRTKPGLKTELTVEKYRTERVSLNRAAEIAGLSLAGFREILYERGVVREAGFLSDEDRNAKLDDL